MHASFLQVVVGRSKINVPEDNLQTEMTKFPYTIVSAVDHY